MKLTPHVFLTRLKAGFSLIELQVVIAIIALLAAIIVPQIPRLTSQACHARGRENARNLASIAMAAGAEGIEFTSLDMALATVVRPGGVGSGTGLHCGGSSLSPAQVAEAKEYLGFSNGQVVYLSD